MKKAILYLLLLTYSTNLLKPVLPYITDTAAHIFWYSEHMATVHYENGKYHVHTEALNAAKKTDFPKSTNAGKTETVSSEHVISKFEYSFENSPLGDLNFPNLSCSLPCNLPAGDYPPPRNL